MAQKAEEIFEAEVDSGSWRRQIETIVCQSEKAKLEYLHTDTTTLLDQFKGKVNDPDTRSIFVMASRHFSNINHINDAYKDSVVGKVRTWSWWTGSSWRVVRDPSKVSLMKQTFNGPALLPHLLPPSEYIAGRQGHPSLQAHPMSDSWKDVSGKIEAVSDNLPSYFYLTDHDLPKWKDVRRNNKLKQEYQDQFAQEVLSTLDCPRGYPRGPSELHQRVFSLYRVDIVRGKERLKGYRVHWTGDYTYKSNDKTWSTKSEKSTVPMQSYNVYIHDDGASFAFWSSEDKSRLRDEIKSYMDEIGQVDTETDSE